MCAGPPAATRQGETMLPESIPITNESAPTLTVTASVASGE
jgi:hypothetical protein